MRLPCLFIAETEQKGRAVFTNEALEAGTLLETAPVIVMTGEERKLIDQTRLHDYIFVWGDDNDQCAMALGWISVYNHSYQSNAEYYMDFETEQMFVKTVWPIAAGEEVTINYNGTWNDETKVWFDVVG
ncbi:SET domain-containing protein [Lacibacter sp. H407]|uniref:SET domain-containing protein n=1 Tax=Lacibacter sp. H407 TaxID=3133423 RepID=UPI0030BF08A2